MDYWIRSGGLAAYPRVAAELGCDAVAGLTAAGLPNGILDDPERRVPVRAFAGLLEQLARAGAREDVGLLLAEHGSLDDLGPIAGAIAARPTLGQALLAVDEFCLLHNNCLVSSRESHGGVVLLRHEFLAGVGVRMRYANQLAVARLFQIVREWLGPGWQPRQVCFQQAAPKDASVFRRVFGKHVEFGAMADGILLDARHLEAPRNAASWRVAPYFHLPPRRQPGELAFRARQLVWRHLASNDCNAERVAAAIGVDRSTLSRRLARQGESYSHILHELRRELVLRQLDGAPRRSLSELADVLGFTTLSCFSRWFRAAFGCAPSAWLRAAGRDQA